MLFGIMAGHIIRLKRTFSERTAWLFVAGNLLIAIGLVCDIWLPINKKLWTSSFSIFMAGLDFASAFHLADRSSRPIQRFLKPLFIMGMNAIAVYMASELGDETLNWIHWSAGENLYASLLDL